MIPYIFFGGKEFRFVDLFMHVFSISLLCNPGSVLRRVRDIMGPDSPHSPAFRHSRLLYRITCFELITSFNSITKA